MLAQCLYLMNGHPLNLSPVSFHQIPSEKKLSIEKNCNKITSLALGTIEWLIYLSFNPIKCLNVTATEFENYS